MPGDCADDDGANEKDNDDSDDDDDGDDADDGEDEEEQDGDTYGDGNGEKNILMIITKMGR